MKIPAFSVSRKTRDIFVGGAKLTTRAAQPPLQLWRRKMGTKKPRRDCSRAFHGDPYGNRTHVTAVKGRCLNRLTNGPGSGNLIRTDDIPGMNRLLYQLSYAAMWSS